MAEGAATETALDRARIDVFVRDHFGPIGTIRLHRQAIGFDLLRAPVNVALAPIFLLSRLLALFLILLRLKGIGRWILRRRIILTTAVARTIARYIEAELLGPPSPGREAHRRQILDDYTAVRSAVSEITTTVIVFVSGYIVFRVATPGVISLAPMLSGFVRQQNAISNFPLGQGLGSVWYGVFPVELPIWYVLAVGFALAMAASLVTTFAGLIADPIQALTGVHRRRLRRLMAADRAPGPAPEGLAREHILARSADLFDAAISALRIFRP